MPLTNQRNSDKLERAISALCYLSGGLIGLLYIILSGNQRHSQSQFFRFHFLQSILLTILYFLVNYTIGLFASIGGGIIGAIGVPQGITAFEYLLQGIHLVMSAALFLFAYGMIWSALGKHAQIPIISDLVRRNM